MFDKHQEQNLHQVSKTKTTFSDYLQYKVGIT